MSDDTRTDIGVPQIRAALDTAVHSDPHHIEFPPPICDWPRLCGPTCRFPRYLHHGQAHGLTATVLIHLGYNSDLLKALDCEYEIGELIHPGVKIHHSRHKALTRIHPDGLQLLAYLQNRQHTRHTWTRISAQALRRNRLLPFLDVRKRPWLH